MYKLNTFKFLILLNILLISCDSKYSVYDKYPLTNPPNALNKTVLNKVIELDNLYKIESIDTDGVISFANFDKQKEIPDLGGGLYEHLRKTLYYKDEELVKTIEQVGIYPIKISNYKDGELHGIQIECQLDTEHVTPNDNNYKLRNIENYKQGKRHGKSIRYGNYFFSVDVIDTYNKGVKLSSFSTNDNNLKHGYYRFFDKDGLENKYQIYWNGELIKNCFPDSSKEIVIYKNPSIVDDMQRVMGNISKDMLSDEDLKMIRTVVDNDNISIEDVGNIILGTRSNPSAIKIRKALIKVEGGRDVYDKFKAITKAGVDRKVNVDGVKIGMIEAVKKNISQKILINECLDTVSVEKPLENLKLKREFMGEMIYKEINYKLVEDEEKKWKAWVKDGSYKYYLDSYHLLSERYVDNIKFNQVLSSGNYLNDKKEGEWLEYYNNGDIKSKRYYNNGKSAGIWKTYFNDGKLNTVGESDDDGNRIGNWLTYYKNGTIKEEQLYDNGQKTGKWTSFYKDGTIQKIGFYDNQGKKTGSWLEYFESGTIKIKENYVNGNREGKWYRYYQNGQLEIDGNYIYSKRDGKWKSYSYKGNLTKESNYINGFREGKWLYYHSNGTIREEQNYIYRNTGKIRGELRIGKGISYYSNGNIHKIEYYDDDGRKIGNWVEYHDNGIINVETNYKSGKRDGLQIIYNRNSKKLQENLYKNNLLINSEYFLD